MSRNARPQTIFRNASPKRQYTQLCNDMLRDCELSLEATGFLARILSHPPHWDFCKSWAQTKFDVGEKKLDRVMKELATLGYSKHGQLRNEDGTHGKVVYYFTDMPWTFDDDDRSPKNNPAVDGVANEHRSPVNGGPVERESRQSRISKIVKEDRTEKEKNVYLPKVEIVSVVKKYASEPSVGVDEEDIRDLALSIKRMDKSQLIAGGVMYTSAAYAKLGDMMLRFPPAVVEEAIRSVINREMAGGHMRKGGIRCWSYFEGVVRDLAMKKALAAELLAEAPF